MKVDIFRNKVSSEKYIFVDYFVGTSANLKVAAEAIALGQSIGNPSVRSKWETQQMFEDHSCMILASESDLINKKEGMVRIAFPLANINLKEDGVTQLLVQIMGGQLDIDFIEKCQIMNIEFPPQALSYFRGPKYGIQGMREFTGAWNKPILGGIVKPKVGASPEILLEMVKQMVDGGINFIKEDEIMSNPACCPIEKRVPLIMKYLEGKKVVYSVCINSDYPYVMDRVKQVHELGGNGIHVNVWNGLGIYRSIRELDLPLFVHFQKSGDRIFTNPKHDYYIHWNVICQLAGMMGVDTIHAGMWGGYSSKDEMELRKTMAVLHKYDVLPALSCGMHAGLIQAINKRFGVEYMANVGGALHGHPEGTLSGVKALRQAIDGNHQKEYQQSIEKWPLVN